MPRFYTRISGVELGTRPKGRGMTPNSTIKKPCLIGTQHATWLFKDGDSIEVDAGKGIVKVLAKTS